MKVVDRILLVILILLLPIGLFISHRIITGQELVSSNKTTIDAKKLKAMVDNYAELELEVNKEEESFTISSVSYASSSGVLSVEGQAPSNQASVIMSVTVLPATPPPSSPSTAIESEELVLGNSVETVALSTDEKGVFVFDFPVEYSQSLVEVRLEQEKVVRTIRYDLARKIQLL